MRPSAWTERQAQRRGKGLGARAAASVRDETEHALRFPAGFPARKYSEQNSMYAMIGVFTIVMFAVLWAIPWFTYLKDEEEIEERRGAGGRRGRGARSLRHQRWPWPVRRRIRAGEGEGRRQGEVRPPFSATCSVFKAPRDLAVQGEGGGRAWTMSTRSVVGSRTAGAHRRGAPPAAPLHRNPGPRHMDLARLGVRAGVKTWRPPAGPLGSPVCVCVYVGRRRLPPAAGGLHAGGGTRT
ncbi:unnamed protein product [Prorocentrum cordatum]|uniref:Uncharacterized protein n=1 Tax=Prorocentrum cordatum TaxID=2364126 RepID=A0ABN9WG88_9DINO|nr:unnamed protein product [Polarella glacialis]